MSAEKNKNDSRKFIQLLTKNGFKFYRRGKGDHSIYTNGNVTISVPHRMNKMLRRRLVKEYELT